MPPKFIGIEAVFQLHEGLLQEFGGASGVRDPGLLDSALAQSQATFGGELLHSTLWEQASAYLFHLAMNHPFLDGNKRTAYAVMDSFLRINGYVLNLTQDEKYELVIRVARGEMSKDDLAIFLQSAVPAS